MTLKRRSGCRSQSGKAPTDSYENRQDGKSLWLGSYCPFSLTGGLFLHIQHSPTPSASRPDTAKMASLSPSPSALFTH